VRTLKEHGCERTAVHPNSLMYEIASQKKCQCLIGVASWWLLVRCQGSGGVVIVRFNRQFSVLPGFDRVAEVALA